MTPAEALEIQTRMFPVGGADESAFDPRVAFAEMRPCVELLPHGAHPSCALTGEYRNRFKLYYSGLPPTLSSAQPAKPQGSDYAPKWGVWSHVGLRACLLGPSNHLPHRCGRGAGRSSSSQS
jgi:hypothetical protein